MMSYKEGIFGCWKRQVWYFCVEMQKIPKHRVIESKGIMKKQSCIKRYSTSVMYGVQL